MSVSKLVLSFVTMEGETLILSYNYAKPDVTVNAIKSLANGIVTAGSIFSKVPVLAKSVKLVTSTENEFDLNA